MLELPNQIGLTVNIGFSASSGNFHFDLSIQNKNYALNNPNWINTELEELTSKLLKLFSANQAPLIPSKEEVKIAKNIALMCDFENIDISARENGYQIRYERLAEQFSKNGTLSSKRLYSSFKSTQLGHKVLTKVEKDFGFEIIPPIADLKNSDSKIITDITKIAVGKQFDSIVLIAGDRCYCDPLEECKKNGIEVIVCSFLQNTAKSLKAIADTFIDIESLKGVCVKKT